MVIDGLSAAVSALRAAGQRLSQTSHNLANANTTGFVPRRVDLAETASGGVAVSGTTMGQSGPIVASDRPLDLALDGGGFFVLNHGGRQVYTRAGNFVLDAQGQISDLSGRTLNPAITIPAEATSVHVTSQGQVQALAADGTVLSQGQLQTAVFGNPGGLQAIGDGLYVPTAASGPPVSAAPGTAGHGTVVSGAYQASGTDVAGEMVNLILDQRGFEANVKSAQTMDEMLGAVLDIKT